ncbi:uncharacterized protein LOC129758744 [Uranotaenia lowii]|uniref:uncharacterized protein LOC129758744 n=1 Tax=Uranotaenia lowii TaxID=190385 RepID=UPI002479748C|nr:uncharacterized protein LOC129758744 [Uranotaenia lowii]
MDESRALPMFRCEQIENSKLAKEWADWRGALECYFESCQITDQKLMRAKMLHLGGPQLQKVFRSLEGTESFATVLIEKPWYNVAVDCLDAYFKPQRQDVLERHKLREIRQGSNERFGHFVLRLRQQIKDCGLEKYSLEVREVLEEILLTDGIAEGCTSLDLRRKIFEKDRTLAEIEALGQSFESVKIQESEMNKHATGFHDKNQLDVHKIQSRPYSFDKKQNRVVNRFYKFQAASDRPESKILCYGCGGYGHIAKSYNCPAKGKRCPRCNAFDHSENVCRRQTVNRQFRHMQDQRTSKKGMSTSVMSINQSNEQKPEQQDVEKEVSQEEQKVYYTFYTGNKSNEIVCHIVNLCLC